MRKSIRGFTLIEILVAISIIGIIFGVIISSVSIIQKNSRDAKRRSDLRNIQTALQQYYSDQQFYPSHNSSFGSNLDLGTVTNITSAIGNPTPPSSTKTYMSVVPKDPSSGNNYCYRSSIANTAPLVSCNNGTDKCQFYVLCAQLENPGSGDIDCSTECGSGYRGKIAPI